MVTALVARFEERADGKAIVEEEDNVEQPRIGVLQLLDTVMVQEVDPKEQRTTLAPRRSPIGWVSR